MTLLKYVSRACQTRKKQTKQESILWTPAQCQSQMLEISIKVPSRRWKAKENVSKNRIVTISVVRKCVCFAFGRSYVRRASSPSNFMDVAQIHQANVEKVRWTKGQHTSLGKWWFHYRCRPASWPRFSTSETGKMCDREARPPLPRWRNWNRTSRKCWIFDIFFFF